MESSHDSAQGFLAQHPLGVLATIDSIGHPVTAAVYCVMDNDLSIYFLSPDHTRKLDNIEQHPEVSLTFIDEATMSLLQVQGTAAVLATPVEAIAFNAVPKTVTEALLNIHTVQRTTGLTPAFKTGGTTQYFVKITPTWMRLADFKQSGSDQSKVYTMIVG